LFLHNAGTFHANCQHRQFEIEPFYALRAAKEDDLVIVTNRDHAEALLIALDKLGLPDVDAVRTAWR